MPPGVPLSVGPLLPFELGRERDATQNRGSSVEVRENLPLQCFVSAPRERSLDTRAHFQRTIRQEEGMKAGKVCNESCTEIERVELFSRHSRLEGTIGIATCREDVRQGAPSIR